MEFPSELLYTKDHLWIKESDDTITIGLTDYAQDQLGDILFVELPNVGSSFAAGDNFLAIESAKTASDLSLPFGGEIVAVNNALDDSPELINENAYETWICEIKLSGGLDGTLSAAEYQGGLDEE